MLVTLDIKNESMKDSFLNFIATLDYIDIKSDTKVKDICEEKSSRGKFSAFSGMWKNKDIDINTIREEAWKK